jgi:hypothetical protein
VGASIPLLLIGRSSRPKKKNQQRNLRIKWHYRQNGFNRHLQRFHPLAVQYTFFLETYRTHSRINHILEHKASCSKYKKVEITLCILSDHNGMKTRTQQQKKLQKKKNSNTWKLNNHWRTGREGQKFPRI